jgi:hypothetical protein
MKGRDGFILIPASIDEGKGWVYLVLKMNGQGLGFCT